MSFKMFNGCKFLAKDTEELIAQCRAARKVAQPALDEKVVTLVARILYGAYDLACWNNTEYDPSTARNRAKCLSDRLFQNIEILFTQVDGELYGVFYGNTSDIDISGVIPSEPYGYWDNTDPDEDVTEEEWERRRFVWTERIFGADDYIPSAVMARFDIATVPDFDTGLGFYNHKPMNLLDRARLLAGNMNIPDDEEFIAMAMLKLDENKSLLGLF